VDRDAGSDWALFAGELKAARLAANWSRADLARRTNYSESLIGLVENGHRAPTLDFARSCDEAFGSQERATFVRLQRATRSPLPSWFRPWADVEAAASQLRLFEHSLVPGLLQTEDYARGVLATRPGVTEDELADLLAARMERQLILSRDQPPRLWVVLDEAVLHRQVGSAKVMHDQLEHLVGMADRPFVTVEVVPYSAGAHSGLLGACAIAEGTDRSQAAYLETLAEGYPVETPATVAALLVTFDTVRSEALPRGASRAVLAKKADDYGRSE
jgi:transcriptional regulator with XRE-family HTH domain